MLDINLAVYFILFHQFPLAEFHAWCGWETTTIYIFYLLLLAPWFISPLIDPLIDICFRFGTNTCSCWIDNNAEWFNVSIMWYAIWQGKETSFNWFVWPWALLLLPLSQWGLSHLPWPATRSGYHQCGPSVWHWIFLIVRASLDECHWGLEWWHHHYNHLWDKFSMWEPSNETQSSIKKHHDTFEPCKTFIYFFLKNGICELVPLTWRIKNYYKYSHPPQSQLSMCVCVCVSTVI